MYRPSPYAFPPQPPIEAPSEQNSIFLWGRRYENQAYPYPNDDLEQDRLDYQYAVLQTMIGVGELHEAPISSSPEKILDVGSGTGIWGIDMAERYPNSRVMGLDISRIQPTNHPRNLAFRTFDCNQLEWGQGWLGSIDFVHSRMMFGALEDFRQFINTAKGYLKPNAGWLECQDLLPKAFTDDGTIPNGWGYDEWVERYRNAATSCEPTRAVMTANKIKTWMSQDGFVDIQEKVYKIPIGTWPADENLKRLGGLWRQNIIDGLQGKSYKLFGPLGLGWRKEQIDEFLRRVHESLCQHGVHAYHKFYVVYGRRPGVEQSPAAASNSGSSMPHILHGPLS